MDGTEKLKYTASLSAKSNIHYGFDPQQLGMTLIYPASKLTEAEEVEFGLEDEEIRRSDKSYEPWRIGLSANSLVAGEKLMPLADSFNWYVTAAEIELANEENIVVREAHPAYTTRLHIKLKPSGSILENIEIIPNNNYLTDPK
ncbi:MAG: hypothetical protein HUJ56_08885, partial [Erysipelotrichaceae bacterium]|nr:hypothetical protein [Erysipelotrichaceae bacterium]